MKLQRSSWDGLFKEFPRLSCKKIVHYRRTYSYLRGEEHSLSGWSYISDSKISTKECCINGDYLGHLNSFNLVRLNGIMQHKECLYFNDWEEVIDRYPRLRCNRVQHYSVVFKVLAGKVNCLSGPAYVNNAASYYYMNDRIVTKVTGLSELIRLNRVLCEIKI